MMTGKQIQEGKTYLTDTGKHVTCVSVSPEKPHRYKATMIIAGADLGSGYDMSGNCDPDYPPQLGDLIMSGDGFVEVNAGECND